MPTFEIINGTVTTNLNNGSPLRLEESDDLFADAPARRLRERGPEQHGHTDLGGRLDTPTITLRFNFFGTSGSALDGYRDTLRAAFPANPGSPSQLRVTRDDGAVRQLDVYRVGRIGIPINAEQRAGLMHRAVVQVEAPDAVWYDPTQQGGTLLTPSDWWLGFNTIGSANVLEHVESPGTAQAWSYTGTVTAGSPFMIAFRSEQNVTSNVRFAFAHGDDGIGEQHNFSAGTVTGVYNAFARIANTLIVQGTSIHPPGTHNYFLIYFGGSVAEAPFFRTAFYLDGVRITSEDAGVPNQPRLNAPANERYWRANFGGLLPWTAEIPRAAIYDIAPSALQIAALNEAMATSSSGSVYSGSIVYQGDWLEYPVIRINGPISSPILTNATTGETLDFTGHSIASEDWYEINCRYGNKTVLNSGGDNKIDELTDESNLETFHLAPNQVNVLSLFGTAPGTAANAVITYYNRYTGP